METSFFCSSFWVISATASSRVSGCPNRIWETWIRRKGQTDIWFCLVWFRFLPEKKKNTVKSSQKGTTKPLHSFQSLHNILTKRSRSNYSELCWGRQKPEKDECDQTWTDCRDKLLHHLVLGMCKRFTAQLKPCSENNMSYFSEPRPISDRHNHADTPNTGIQCLVCSTWSTVFLPPSH